MSLENYNLSTNPISISTITSGVFQSFLYIILASISLNNNLLSPIYQGNLVLQIDDFWLSIMYNTLFIPPHTLRKKEHTFAFSPRRITHKMDFWGLFCPSHTFTPEHD